MGKTKSGNGEKLDDYVVLAHIPVQGLERTLNLYSQNEWDLKGVLPSDGGEYIIIFRRELDNEF